MDYLEIIIDEKYCESFGSNSLIGHIMNLSEYNPPSEIHLVFKQSSLEFRKKNNGPKEWIIPEYTMMCFIKDILFLRASNINIVIKEMISDD